MSPWRVFLELPLRERVGVVVGGFAVAVGAWVVVVGTILLGGPPT